MRTHIYALATPHVLTLKFQSFGDFNLSHSLYREPACVLDICLYRAHANCVHGARKEPRRRLSLPCGQLCAEYRDARLSWLTLARLSAHTTHCMCIRTHVFIYIINAREYVSKKKKKMKFRLAICVYIYKCGNKRRSANRRKRKIKTKNKISSSR